ncbi:gliding motility-associated ABC transporter substrate-binding protein GldG [Robiginitalea sp. IMCC43444]|uniref:gliding motility-associated ABC transporter substrate-binding protein GldG n=1 Tax=Robiginitalea sp. IMCC43444 TaxID=3459121 RepID=UPI0040431155
MKNSKLLSRLIGLVLLVGLLNLLSQYIYKRWDLTEDKRFTLAPQSIAAAEALEGPVVVDVLLEGDLPAEFLKLRRETALLLEQFSEINSNIQFTFADPMEGTAGSEETLQQLQALGLKPASVTTEENNRVSQELVFPWAMVTNGERTEKVALLRNLLGATMEERINNSIQYLEYGLADAFTKLGFRDKKKVAILKGNGELEDRYLADFLTTLKGYYNLAAFTLDSVETNAAGTLQSLTSFDAAIIAKPTEAFTDLEKYLLDQYMVAGGKTLWLVDAAAIEMDSLMNETGEAVALRRDLGLGDLFFRYGLRLNADLINDLYCTQIVMATGSGSGSQYNPVPWFYYPMLFSADNHPINRQLEALRMQFAGSIDTLENAYKKTVLYTSSPLSKKEGVPRMISLNLIRQEPDRSTYGPGNYPVAVLVEGAFQSAYKNRIRPSGGLTYQEEGPENKMIVISDGDLIANQLQNGRPLELGYDKWTNNFYGNKEFLLNAVNYLLDDSGLINIRNKEVRIPLLDPEKIATSRGKWQLLNIGLPLLLIVLIGWGFNYIRRRRFR